MQRGRCWLSVVCLATLFSGVDVAAQEEPPEAPPPAAAPATPAAAPAQPELTRPSAEDDHLITMDFQDVDLPVLVKFISEITGKNFILDERVKGKITIISPSKITVDEAYTVFQSVLQVKGFTTVPAGSVIKIVQAQEAKSNTLDTVLPGQPGSVTDEFITKLMPLKNVEANNILAIIQPLVSANGLLVAYGATNTLILIDSASNIARIGQIVRELDVEGSEQQTEVIRLNYAFAAEIAAIIAQVLEEAATATTVTPASAPGQSSARSPGSRRSQSTPPAGQPAASSQGGTGESAFKIIPEERTNALIVVAGALQMRRIKDLIARLDVPIPLGTGRIHVYHLKYANAFEVVPVLADLIGGGGGGIGGLAGGLAGRSLASSTAFRGGRLGQRGDLAGQLSGFGASGFGTFGSNSGFGSGGFGASGSLRGGIGSRGQRGGGAFGLGGPGVGRGTIGGAGGGTVSAAAPGGGEFEGDVRVTADPSTNALIVNASPQDFETLKRVIELLDTRRRQVFVEAMILEVRLVKTRSLGIELQGATGLGNGIGFGRVDFSQSITALSNPVQFATLGGLIAAAASNQTIRLPDGTVIPAQVALLRAAQSDTDVNVLSAPNILTTDNQEAEIVVGQNLPFVASRSTSEVNLNNQFQTIERRDVGVTLRITPQISEGGMVRLDIFQEVSAVIRNPIAGLDPNIVGPSTTIRSATTTVVVREGQTVVIGGLISDDISNSTSKVPFISNIPVLGNLFKSTQADREKINLLIFLTPNIVRGPRDHRDLSLTRRDKVKAFMEEQHIPNKRREQIDTPAWNPDLPPDKTDEDDEDVIDGDGDRPASDRPPTAMAPLAHAEEVVRAEEIAPVEDIVAEPPPQAVRYVLLASFSTRGTPPEGLQTSSGLVAVELPIDSELTTLFQKGGSYRFQITGFEGLYQCLEAYTTPQEALLVYPEGLPVNPEAGEYLHWRQFEDATSSNVAAWTALN
jgi:general secretion pathway protein D